MYKPSFRISSSSSVRIIIYNIAFHTVLTIFNQLQMTWSITILTFVYNPRTLVNITSENIAVTDEKTKN